MRRIVLLLACAAMIASAQAAVELSYSTAGDNTIVTAADGGTTYWEMTVQTGGTQPGRITAFYDKSGASSDTYNYAHVYANGSGILDPINDDSLRGSGTWTISNIVTGSTAMTYTLSRNLTKDTGSATYSMDFTIGIPTITANGYDTNIHVADTLFYDANWVGANMEGVITPVARLQASADNDEYTFVTHNGIAQGGAPNLSVEATVTDADPNMAAGSTFTNTLTYNLYDQFYDNVSGSYSSQITPYAKLFTQLGITGIDRGNPGPAGSDRTFTAGVDLDISIVPEPMTTSLLGLGAVALLRRKRK